MKHNKYRSSSTVPPSTSANIIPTTRVNDKMFIIKLKDLLKNFQNDTKITDTNLILNDLYASIDKNLNDKRVQLIYLPNSNTNSNLNRNETLFLLSKLTDPLIDSSQLNAQHHHGLTSTSTKLALSEIVLIFFIVSLWLLSIICCLKRYSLLLCFRKRDTNASYYNRNDDQKININNPIPNPPANANTNNNNNDNNMENYMNTKVCLVDNYPSQQQHHHHHHHHHQTITTVETVNENTSNIANAALSDNTSLKCSSSLLNQPNNSHLHFNKLTKPNSLQQLTHLLLRHHHQQQLEQLRQQYTNISNSKLSLDHMQNRYLENKNNPSSTTTVLSDPHHVKSTSITTASEAMKTSAKDRRHLLVNNQNSKHFNLLSLDETALKYCNYKLNKYKKQQQQQYHHYSPSRFVQAQNSIQESDTSSILYRDYSLEDNSSVFEDPIRQHQVQGKYLRAQYSLSPNTYSDELSTNSSLNRVFQQPTTSAATTTPVATTVIATTTSNTNTSNTTTVDSFSTQSTLTNQLTTDSYFQSSGRQINPMSSLKRHMFVNSRKTFNKHSAHVSSNSELNSNNNSYKDNDNTIVTTNPCPPPPTPSSTLSTTTLSSGMTGRTFNEHHPQTSISIQTQKPKYIQNSFALNQVPEQPLEQMYRQLHQQQIPIPMNELNQIADPNLLNPSWIPAIVRETLLELHHRAVLSKSDSNIKTKRPSNNNNSKENKRKKPLSLQNSEDQSALLNVNAPVNLELLEEARKKLAQQHQQKQQQPNNGANTNQPINSSSSPSNRIKYRFFNS